MPPKRKQTPDMPTSPPKRVTRARAKKDVNSKIETRITTASARVSAKKKNNATDMAKPQVTLPQLDVEMTEGPEGAAATEEPVVEAPKTRGKSKATRSTAATSAKATSAPSTAPAKSTRSRSNDTTATVNKEEQPPKSRGRPKRTARPEVAIASESAIEDVAPEPQVKMTRGRAATVATKAPSTRTRAAAAAPKKKVKFDDQSEQDKENQPLVLDTKDKPLPKATGLRAKPVRKPAATRNGTRRTKGEKQDVQVEENAPKRDLLPLSPKKVTQVAKTPSVGSEDELAPEKTPLKPLTISPSNIPMSVNCDQDITVARLELTARAVHQSPKKDTSPSRLAVSPRKPPPSPFKDALKYSPRRINLGSRVSPTKPDAPLSPSKSPLKDAPKRLNLGDSNVKPILQWSKTPMKSSLFQSPARRPGSAMKTSSMFSSSKAGFTVPTVDAAAASKEVSTLKLPELVSVSAASSPFGAAETPSQQYKVHDSSKESRAQASSSPQSPSKQPQADDMHEACASEVEDIPLEPEEVSLSTDELTMSGNPALIPQGDELSSADLGDDSSIVLEQKQETIDADASVDQQPAERTVTDLPDAPTSVPAAQIFAKPAFVLRSSMITCNIDDSESEDDLSPQKSVATSPLKNFGISAKDFGTVGLETAPQDDTPSTKFQRASSRAAKRDSIAMTPLALQMGSWLASSPEKHNAAQKGHKCGIFSPNVPNLARPSTQSPTASAVGSPAKVSFFDDEMAVCEVDDDSLVLDEGSTDELEGPSNQEFLDLQASQDSQTSEVYGDENAAPEEANMTIAEQLIEGHTLTCTPARVFEQQVREIHTVSKVPLRAAADDTPLKVPRKRSRSLAGPLSDISMLDRMSISRDSILSPILQDANLSMSMLPGDVEAPNTPETPTAGPKSALNTPGRSIRKAGYSNALKGAVVHVDVHTTEGADASGIFVDLLTQMGARCVKQWHWNPQTAPIAGLVHSPEQTASAEAGTQGSKIGITHVVYKDGGKRTLEKVREAKGAVLCVGVGWVLDCEREDKWLDEADYAVDTSIIPRGGSRRRKSMEPRALANLNGSLILAETPVKAPAADISPTKEFLTFDTPASRRETFEIPTLQLPATPAAELPHAVDGGFDSPLSPTTPYYLSKGAQLVQQTCPPKQSQELFFPLTGKIEDQPDEAMRQRLLMARRKSLQWTSKVQSPLGRTVSYGK
ncbi:MAG: hypothetical protein Q9218_004973 [Villophora microphyllina]